MDGGQEIPSKLVIASCDTPEVLEPAEATLDDISSFVGALAEAVEGDPIGFVWNDRLSTAIDDFGAEAVTIVAFVADERGHGRSEF